MGAQSLEQGAAAVASGVACMPNAGGLWSLTQNVCMSLFLGLTLAHIAQCHEGMRIVQEERLSRCIANPEIMLLAPYVESLTRFKVLIVQNTNRTWLMLDDGTLKWNLFERYILTPLGATGNQFRIVFLKTIRKEWSLNLLSIIHTGYFPNQFEMRVSTSLTWLRWEIAVIDQCQIEYENLSGRTHNKLYFAWARRQPFAVLASFNAKLSLRMKVLELSTIKWLKMYMRDNLNKRNNRRIKRNLKRISVSPLEIKITIPKNDSWRGEIAGEKFYGMECPLLWSSVSRSGDAFCHYTRGG